MESFRFWKVSYLESVEIGKNTNLESLGFGKWIEFEKYSKLEVSCIRVPIDNWKVS